MYSKNVLSIGIISALLLLSACDQHKHFDSYTSIPDSKWNSESPLEFSTEISDTSQYYNMLINVRNSGDYSYANLYLFINTTIPGGVVQRDTVECILADKTGKWTGKGLGGIWASQIMFRKGFKFPIAGTYKFELVQAMREDPLHGIKDAGIRLERSVDL